MTRFDSVACSGSGSGGASATACEFVDPGMQTLQLKHVVYAALVRCWQM